MFQTSDGEMVKIARSLDGLMVLIMKMLTIHCHLFVFGQESGYWLTCLCESICFAEAASFDLRIVWDGAVWGEGYHEGILRGMLCLLLDFWAVDGYEYVGSGWSGPS